MVIDRVKTIKQNNTQQGKD